MKKVLAVSALAFLLASCSSEEPPAAAREDDHAAQTPGRVVLSEAAVLAAQIAVEPARSERTVRAAEALEVPGQVEFDPRRVAIISPRTPGRIERLLAVEGDRVAAGQVVAYLQSSLFVTAQAEFLQATRRAKALATTPDSAGAAALTEAAARRLRLLGLPPSEIERLASTGEAGDFLPIVAPFEGSIVGSEALPGAAIEAGAPIFKLADLSVVDVVAAVPERALPSVKVGQAATILLPAYPNVRFTGHVERLHDELNPETRTVHAVIHVPNGGRNLRPGMFASVRLDVSVQVAEEEGVSVVTIPETAVVTDGEKRHVFVEIAPRTYEQREVQVRSLAPPGAGSSVGQRVGVTVGLKAGERVVVRGAFTLKSELAKASFAEEEH